MRIYFVAFCILFFAGFLILEGGSRVLLSLRIDQNAKPWLASWVNKSLPLDGYEMASPDILFHWLLRPGYAQLSKNVAKEKMAEGKTLGMQAFQPDLTARPSDPEAFRGVTVNSLGFRGPEMSLSASHRKIIAIGDSVTFGLGEVSYPDELGFMLKRIDPELLVINAGVEGYALRNHEIELARYKRLKPDAALIFLGWNDIYGLNIGGGWAAKYSALVSSLVKAWQILIQPKFAIDWWSAETPDHLSAQIHLRPAVEHELQKLIERYGRYTSEISNNGTKVFIMTLPSLLRPGSSVDSVILQRAQMPHYAVSVDEFASMIDRFNQLLRNNAKTWGVQVIDLAEWSGNALQPRKSFFLDNVHMTSTALKMIANKIYSALQKSGVYDDFKNESVIMSSKKAASLSK
jgi:lysophospholipase L1-like esterase